ncbi:MAG: class I SAM-dependent methyltransferase [Deltaproteobacteria bacterium]|nr:class I SAM-dependent methyltransferase [Deltaproteobacteria bacterium]
MRPGMLANITAPYTAGEAWAYDRFIAPAVMEFVDRLDLSPWQDVPAGARVLDVGCGGGQTVLEALSRRPDLRVTGLDLAWGQVERARRRAGSAGARFVRGSALDLPFASGSFDVVVSVASIKHWPDPRRGLAECVRVLGPSGRLLVVEADRSCRLEDAQEFVSRWRLPRLSRSVYLALFRTWVAGRSFDLDEARSLAADLPLVGLEVQRIPRTPALAITGRRS